ncbi:hypothetical protein D5085_15495 [Ectothiorhodospiraceae bacterium BW-2]|nr:hypothetical protein D5085_15495 [Ectothiorhodospiraceae bacterium BW-2]
MRGRAMLILLLLLPLGGSLSASEGLIFSVSPGRTQTEREAQYGELIAYLSQQLATDVKMVIHHRYDDLSYALQHELSDIAIISAAQYVQIASTLPQLRYVATIQMRSRDGGLSDSFQTYLVSLKQSRFRQVADLKQSRLGLKDVGSTSGYLLPILMLSKQGIDYQSYFNEIFFLRKSSKLAQALVAGSIDVAALSRNRYLQSVQQYGDIFHIIDKSPPYPESTLVVAPHLDQARVEKITEAVVNYRSESEVNAAPISFVAHGDSYYDVVRQSQQLLNLFNSQ